MNGKAEHCKQEKSKNKITGITERRERMTEWKPERKIAKRKKGWELKKEMRTSEERMQERKERKTEMWEKQVEE